MRGLIYKDISIFFKSIDKKLILIAAAAIVLLIFNAGIYAGLFASVMFAMTIGMQNIMSFASDEKASWKKYQLAMPISNFTVVASKYVSVIYTVAISILGSIAFNSLSSIIFQNFNNLYFSIFINQHIFYKYRKPIYFYNSLSVVRIIYTFCINIIIFFHFDLQKKRALLVYSLFSSFSGSITFP